MISLREPSPRLLDLWLHSLAAQQFNHPCLSGLSGRPRRGGRDEPSRPRGGKPGAVAARSGDQRERSRILGRKLQPARFGHREPGAVGHHRGRAAQRRVGRPDQLDPRRRIHEHAPAEQGVVRPARPAKRQRVRVRPATPTDPEHALRRPRVPPGQIDQHAQRRDRDAVGVIGEPLVKARAERRPPFPNRGGRRRGRRVPRRRFFATLQHATSRGQPAWRLCTHIDRVVENRACSMGVWVYTPRFLLVLTAPAPPRGR